MSASAAAPVIFLFGSTGNVGRPLVRLLSSTHSIHGYRIRCQTRDTQSDNSQQLAKLPHVELHTADYSSDDGVRAAMQDVTRVYIVNSPFDMSEVPHVQAWMRLGKGQLEFVIYLSAMATGEIDYSPVHTAGEAAVRTSGIPHAFLRPIRFMQNFTNPRHKPFAINKGHIMGADGDIASAAVDCRDIAECLAAILTAPTTQLAKYDGQAYALTGVDLLTGDEQAAMFTRYFNTPITFDNVSMDEYKSWLEGLGMPQPFVQGLMRGLTYMRTGHAAYVAPGVRDILGREPRGWKEFLADYGKDMSVE